MLCSFVLAASLVGQFGTTPAPNLPPVVVAVPPGGLVDPVLPPIPGGYPAVLTLVGNDTATASIAARKGFRPRVTRLPMGLPAGFYFLPIWRY